MSNKKKLGLLSLSVTIVSLCLLLLAIWLFFFFRTGRYTGQQPAAGQGPAANTAAAAAQPAIQRAKDSLAQLYALTARELDSQIDSTRNNLDTLKSHLDTKLSESAGLRSEITALLKNSDPGTEGLELTRQKIAMLQQKVNELRRINADVESENRRLRALLSQVENRTVAAPYTAPAAASEKSSSTSLVVSDLRLTALQLDEEKERETNQAQQADRLAGSFTVKNTGSAAEIVVVVQQPDGQVLQQSTWETGTFETREGKRVYSLKVKCDNAKDEARPCRFYLSSDRFQKGNYTMQLYQNGNMVARLVKVLS